MVAVEGVIASPKTIGSRRNLGAGEFRRIVRVICPGILKLGQVVLTWLTIRQNRSEEGAGVVVLDIDLDANGLEVLLQDQLVSRTPGIVGCSRVLELQPLAILCTIAIRALGIPCMIQQGIRASGIKF